MINDFKILNNINKQNCYTAPENYFTNLATLILLKIKSKQPVYTKPENYFENNVTKILVKVKAENDLTVNEELQKIAPLLNKINKQNIYAVPNQYFENTNHSTTKVVKYTATNWHKYAVAAVVILTLGFGYFSLNNNANKINSEIAQLHQKAVNTNIGKEIVDLPDTELNGIVEPIKNNDETTAEEEMTITNFPFNDKIENEVKLLSDDEIESYFNSNLVEAEHT